MDPDSSYFQRTVGSVKQLFRLYCELLNLKLRLCLVQKYIRKAHVLFYVKLNTSQKNDLEQNVLKLFEI